MKRIIRLSTITFALVLFMLAFSACGKKTKPIPPQSLLPEPIADLTYTLDDRGVLLTWTYSGHVENGTIVTQQPDFEVIKSEIALEEYCPDCPIQFGNPVVHRADKLKADSFGKLTYRDKKLKAGYYYQYKVKPLLGRFSSALESNAVSFLYNAVPADNDDSPNESKATPDLLNEKK